MGDPRRLGFWEPVLDRLKNRLSGWRSRFLSFGGRLVLLKSVLTSLLVYALSVFKAPSGRYGVERGRLCEGGACGSTWWRELARIRDEGGEVGGEWFREYVSRKVGMGPTLFYGLILGLGGWRGGVGVAASVEGVGGRDAG
ncbi:cysteine-rich receptor-like protein kinase, partial [Trifolium pratense]